MGGRLEGIIPSGEGMQMASLKRLLSFISSALLYGDFYSVGHFILWWAYGLEDTGKK